MTYSLMFLYVRIVLICFHTSQIYDIGTEILYQTCFGHNSTQKASPEELQVGIFTKLSEYSEFAIKTRFPKIGFFAQKAPARIFNDSFLIYIYIY